MSDYEVRSLGDAIEMADSWRRSRSHTWFRGHNQVSWPLLTSLARTKDKHAAKEQRDRFCNWLSGDSDLGYLLDEPHVHSLFAVLQHYGVPTHYLDFTTSPHVAGFFAGMGDPNDIASGSYGCIIGIDPDAWVARLRKVAAMQSMPRDNWSEKISVQVPNLWRLQAQSGHFVYLPVGNVESIAPVDRIVFPHDGSTPAFDEADIYPERKSALEERLDEFFTHDLMVDGQRAFRGFFNSLNNPHKQWVDYEGHDSERWLVPGSRAHASWTRVPAEWSAYPIETFEDVRSSSVVRLAVDTASPADTAVALERLVLELLTAGQVVRESPVEFKVTSTVREIPDEWAGFVERSVARAWDGVRRLPFTNQQVAGTVANTVAFACVKVSPAPSFDIHSFKNLLGPDLWVELADKHQTTSRAVVAERSYLMALRPDIYEVIVPELQDRRLQHLRTLIPARDLFDFDLLVDLFAREIIPTQVLIQSAGRAVFYSPLRTVVVGAP